MGRLVVATVAVTLLASEPARPAELVVQVDHVRSAVGQIELCLWQSPRDFPDCTANPTVRRLHVPAATGTVTATFADVPPGTYAVTVFHDEKGLHRVETNFLGIPRSGVGASRDPQARFGPPSFRDAAFRVPEGQSGISITLLYP